MTAYPAWTPASRPGIIPLHPLSFGTVLGRSFVALRQNPRVLLGFALVAQTLAYLLVLVGVGAVAWFAFIRLDTVVPGSDEFNAIMAGSVTLTAITAIVLGLLAGALGIVVQAVVVAEVAHAAVAEKLTLTALWRQVKPVVGRLIGYTVMLVLAITVLLAALVGALVAIGFAALPLAIALGVVLLLGSIPLAWWLAVKLLLVPAAIIIEHATIGGALSRSWTLTRGRFWRTLGVLLLISLAFGFVAQAVSAPAGLLSGGLTTIISPTGEPDTGAIVGILILSLLTQVVTLLIQSVALVVQSTATAIIYIDARMRREGLDLDLLGYVEQRDAGVRDLPDPYRQHVGRVVDRPAAYPAAPQAYAPQAYAPQAYAPQTYAPSGTPPQAPVQGYRPPAAPAPAPSAPAPAAPAPPTGAAPSGGQETRWAAPGSAGGTERATE